MILNDRDRAVINFIEICPSNSFIIQSLFFPSLQTCQRRLNLLCEARLVNRYRSYVNQNYIYYIDKKPRQIEHTLYLSRLYAYWSLKNYRILKFKREIDLGNIRADAIAVIKHGAEIATYLVEVEISNNPIGKKIKNYENFMACDCMDVLGCRPTVLFVTDKNIPQNDLKYEVIKLKHLQT